MNENSFFEAFISHEGHIFSQFLREDVQVEFGAQMSHARQTLGVLAG